MGAHEKSGVGGSVGQRGTTSEGLRVWVRVRVRVCVRVCVWGGGTDQLGQKVDQLRDVIGFRSPCNFPEVICAGPTDLTPATAPSNGVRRACVCVC